MAGELVDFDKVRASLAAKGLEKDGDGGDSGGMDTLEPRVAKLEAGQEHLIREVAALRSDVKEFRSEVRADIREIRAEHRTDFRLTWGGLITVASGLAAMMAKGFKWI